MALRRESLGVGVTEILSKKVVKKTASAVLALSLVVGCGETSESGGFEGGLSSDGGQVESPLNDNEQPNSAPDINCDLEASEEGVDIFDADSVQEAYKNEVECEDVDQPEASGNNDVEYDSLLDSEGSLDFEAIMRQIIEQQAESGDEVALSVLNNTETDLPLLDQILEEYIKEQENAPGLELDGEVTTELPQWIQDLLNNDPRIIESDSVIGPILMEYLNEPEDHLSQPKVTTVPPVENSPANSEDIDYSQDLDKDGTHNLVDNDIDGDGTENPFDTDMDGDGIENSVDAEPWGPMMTMPYWRNSGPHSDNDWIPDKIDPVDTIGGFTMLEEGFLDGFSKLDRATGKRYPAYNTFEQVYRDRLEMYYHDIRMDRALDRFTSSLNEPTTADILFGFTSDSDGDGVLNAFDRLAGVNDLGDSNNNGIPDGRDLFYYADN